MIIKVIIQMNGWIKNYDIYIYTHTHTHTHTVEYYLLLQKEIPPFMAMWMNLEDIMLSEIRQRRTRHDLTDLCNLKRSRTQKQGVEQWLPGDEVVGGRCWSEV